LFPENFTFELFSFMKGMTYKEMVLELANQAERFIDMFRKFSMKYNIYIIGGSHPELRDGKIYNTAHLFTPTGHVYTQDKLHITPGERSAGDIEPGIGIRIFDTPLARIAIQVCYDIEFPEISRLLTLAGVEVIFVPFSTEEKKAYYRVRHCAQARAVENFVYVVMTGTIGNMSTAIGSIINYGQAAILTPSDFPFLGFAVMAEIPLVIVNVQRGGPSTGLPTGPAQGDVMQARWGTHGDHAIIALTASSHQDLFQMTVDAFNLAETYRTPVILLLDEVTGHMREKVMLPERGDIPVIERLRTSVKAGVDYHPYLPREDGRLPMSDFGGEHRYNVTGLYHDMWGFPSTNPKVVHGLIRHLTDKIRHHVKEITRYKEYFLEDARTVMISYGSSARSALHVVHHLRARGERIGLLELQSLWPFPYSLVEEKCRNARLIVVVEMNLGQVLLQVKRAVSNPDRVMLANRVDGVFITPTDIQNILRLIQGKGV
jgi:2-oxoglutarate ferredoxin oxidoreductase subunit alpha